MTFTFLPPGTTKDKIGLFVALVGGTNSGKTHSACRLARGIAGPEGRVAALDTEGGRTKRVAEDDFGFYATIMEPPFRPARFADAAMDAENAGFDAFLIDSFSMEWAGLGGVLDWQAQEHQRLGGQEKNKGASWIVPKMAHKAMVFSLLQRRIPIIFSIRGEETFIPPRTKLFKPITNKLFPFEVTVSFRLESDRKGYLDLSDPSSFKMEGAHQEIFRPGDRLSEEHGAALAAWARGETPPKRGKDALFADARQMALSGTAALAAWRRNLSDKADRALAEITPELDEIAAAAPADGASV